MGSTLFYINQAVSIVDMRQWLIFRIKAFIFGGSDALVSVEENFIMDAYLAIIAQKVFENRDFSSAQKFAVMMMLDDDDLQHLIVEEDLRVKSAVILGIRQYMQ